MTNPTAPLFRRLPALLAGALLFAAPLPAVAGLIPCPGDCDGNGEVAVNELVLAVNIALGDQPVANCPAADRGGDGMVTIDDLLAAVSAALDGCPAPPTPTATGSQLPTATATATGTGAPTFTATLVPSSPTATPTGDQPTATATAIDATATATVGDSTPTATATATDPTPTATATAGDATPTATAVDATATATHTSTPSASPTEGPSTATPTPTGSATPELGPSDLSAMIDADEVRLAWTNPPAEAGRPNAKLLRRLNAPVDGPDDPEATLVFFGAAHLASHALADLLPDVPEQERVYHYAVYACTDADACGAIGAATTLTPELIQVLRAGGYVIHWRHALAGICGDILDGGGTAENPIIPDWWKSCDANCSTATARQISPVGRQQASAIGAAFDVLQLPVGRVLSSEFCRNVTSAELMDFGPPIELRPDITFYVYDEPSRCANSYQLLGEEPAAGSNTALIGHAGFPSTCPVLGELAMSEAAVFKPDGAGGTDFVTRVTFDEWATLYPPGPSDLSAVIVEPHVRLTWIPATAYPGVRLLRRLGEPVEGPDDAAAQVVYAGPADSVLEPLTNLLPSTPEMPRVYYYAIYGCAGGSCEETGSATLLAPTLAQALRAGGYVIHWRHASAAVCSDNLALGTAATTAVPNWWKSCDANCPTGGGGTATARQLSAVGRTESIAIGEAFAARGFPIGRVISSEFCRNVETAALMDFGPPIEESPAITFFVYDEAGRCANSFELLAEAPAPGSNSALIGHAGNTCEPLSDLAWAEAAIYKPNGAGGSTFIERLHWEQWGTLP